MHTLCLYSELVGETNPVYIHWLSALSVMRLQSTFCEYINKCIIWLLSTSHCGLCVSRCCRHQHMPERTSFPPPPPPPLLSYLSLGWSHSCSQTAKQPSTSATGRQVWVRGNLIPSDTVEAFFFSSRNGEAGVGHVGNKTWCVPSVLVFSCLVCGLSVKVSRLWYQPLVCEEAEIWMIL